jgi:hypothetical protein
MRSHGAADRATTEHVATTTGFRPGTFLWWASSLTRALALAYLRLACGATWADSCRMAST